MKKLILLSILLLLIIVSKAQSPVNYSISGIIIDSVSGHFLEYATITVFKNGEKKPITGTTTNKQGKFLLTEIPEGTFNIEFEFIGYIPNIIKDVVVNKKNSSVELRRIVLTRRSIELQGVTVVSQGKLIENKIDKMVFNAEKDLTSQSGVATDVLENPDGFGRCRWQC